MEERDLIVACRERSFAALQVIHGLMLSSTNAKVRLDAALAIIARGYGKPTQPATLSAPEGNPMRVAVDGLEELRAAFSKHLGRPVGRDAED